MLIRPVNYFTGKLQQLIKLDILATVAALNVGFMRIGG